MRAIAAIILLTHTLTANADRYGIGEDSSSTTSATTVLLALAFFGALAIWPKSVDSIFDKITPLYVIATFASILWLLAKFIFN